MPRKSERRQRCSKKAGPGRGPKFLFSGLLKCDQCGANYTMVNGYRYALTDLAWCLPPELLAGAFGAARAIQDEGARAEALAALAPCLPSELLPEALGAAAQWDDARTLANLVPRLPPSQRPLVLERIVEKCARLPRREVLRILVQLTPVLAEMRDEELIGGVVRAICDVGRWWP